MANNGQPEPEPDLKERESIINQHIWFDGGDRHTWTGLPELPTAAEMLAPQNVDRIPINPVDEPASSKAEHLKALYHILRAEGIESLRWAMRKYLAKQAKTLSHRQVRDDDYICIYTNVRVKAYILASLGPLVRVSFSTKTAVYGINWKQSKRLHPGSLVVISTAEDNFKTICKVATVAQRPYKDGLDQNPPLVDLMWADPTEAVFDPSQEFIMLQARSGYFEAARHALVGLQHAAVTESLLDKYLHGRHQPDDVPPFIEQDPTADLSSLLRPEVPMREELASHNILQDIPDLGTDTSLDKSQMEALQCILRHQLAIVQGPPGTGKTYTSLSAIKAILASKAKTGRRAPIVVSAQTNHALDQLLVLCQDAGARVMRVGGRTSHAQMANRTVFELRQRSSIPPDAKYRAYQAEKRAIIKQISQLAEDVFGDHLIDPKVAVDAGVITQEQADSLEDDGMETIAQHENHGPFSLWLGESLIAGGGLLEPSQPSYDEDEYRVLAQEFEYEGDDPENIADEHEDFDRIRGSEIHLNHACAIKEPTQRRDWRPKAEQLLRASDDLFAIPPAMRGAVYRIIQARMTSAATKKFTTLLERYIESCKKVKSRRWLNETRVAYAEKIDIIGCTTTGLTKHRGFVAALRPLILLVEEAAETREANVVSALYPSLQQLILVGDHQQLAPQCDIRWLGGPPYNLNVSLFERLVKLGMHYTMLNQQRRMRSELRVILNRFYPTLTDHPMISDAVNPRDVPGMGGKNFWYFDHEWPEDVNAECSKVNDREAQMVVNFFAYLVANNVPADRITVLTFYQGQRKLISRKLRKHESLCVDSDSLNVCTVDSYQGEENDIVLLSLVRSPRNEGNYSVGFLESESRAIVSISRARLGFYVFGNLTNLVCATEDAREIWGKVWNAFTEQGAAKRSMGLPLTCTKHNEEIWIKELIDWDDNLGGCNRECAEMRDCGHRCTLTCHALGHSQYTCNESCSRRLECGHGCQRACGAACSCSCAQYKEITDKRSQQSQALPKHPPADSRGGTSSGDVAKPTPPRSEAKGVDRNRENMTLAERLIADGAENSNMLRDSSRKTKTGQRASTSTRPGSGSGARGIVKRQQDDRRLTGTETLGPDIQELQEQYKADVIKGDEMRLQDQIAKRQNAPPLSETRVVEYYRPTTLVNNRRVLGAKITTESIISGASVEQTSPRGPRMSVRQAILPQPAKLAPVPAASPVMGPLIDFSPTDLSGLLESTGITEPEASIAGEDGADEDDSDESEDLIQF